MPTGAPTPAVHGNPSGNKMRDGFASYITFTSATTIGLWEKTVKPPTIDGGEMTDTTTMHNISWYTGAPRKLKKLTSVQAQVAYDPNALPTIIAHVNIDDIVTVTFPDGGTFCFYGYLQKFEPEAMKEGEMPMANIEIGVTNTDAALTEQAPVYTPGTGT